MFQASVDSSRSVCVQYAVPKNRVSGYRGGGGTEWRMWDKRCGFQQEACAYWQWQLTITPNTTATVTAHAHTLVIADLSLLSRL